MNTYGAGLSSAIVKVVVWFGVKGTIKDRCVEVVMKQQW